MTVYLSALLIIGFLSALIGYLIVIQQRYGTVTPGRSPAFRRGQIMQAGGSLLMACALIAFSLPVFWATVLPGGVLLLLLVMLLLPRRR